MNKNNLEISVIICAYTMERLDDIHEAVNSVLNLTLKPREVIIAIDHNEELFERLQSLVHTPKSNIKDEESRTRAQNSELKIVLNAGTRGASETRNVGIQTATGDILVFVDDDIIAEPDWLENLVRPFEYHTVMAVGGRSVPLWPKNKPPFWFPEEFDFMFGSTAHKKLILQANNEIRNFVSNNAALRKEIFAKIGGWESSLGPNRYDLGGITFNPTGGEEAELCLRIKNKIPGALIVYEPAAIVHHKITDKRATLKYTLNYSYREGITRTIVERLASQYMNNPLAAENLFLRRLLTMSLPERLKNLYKPKNLAQIAMIIVYVTVVGIGYLVGKSRYRRQSSR